MVVFRRAIVIFVTGSLGYAGATVAQTGPGDPPGRVGRLAFIQGTVSFHDNEQTDWAPALVNTPVTSGDAIWTEPNARSEISIAGTRLRMDSATQLDMLALDDTQTRMQLDQGRIDIRTFTYDTRQPYEIVTPRGTISLQQQGDYYVEAGTTEDPTRLGVRQGAAQIQAPNGHVLAVRAGEVGEISGDGSAPQLHTIQTAPPPMPASWAERDRQVVYDKPPQYLSSSITGYEDLNAYGTWSNDPEYGQVWSARSVPAGWSPYSTGRWSYERTYGWTWVDEQPWGFAPYHYGRWAQRNNRWFWVPPERQQRAVYAPALVAFVGGTELGAAIGQQNRAPVGWFPLGPREAYVPPYTSNRDYYRRLNAGARVQQQVLEDRWQRAQRREAIANDNRQFALMNRRFATVVPAEDFARSRPVQRVAIRVPADRLATAPVALLAAPPSPTQSIRASRGWDDDNRRDGVNRPNDPRGNDRTVRDNDRNTRDNDRNGRDNDRNRPDQANAPGAPSRLATMQAIKPEPEREKAPGPKFTPRAAVAANATEPGKTAEPAKPGEPSKAADGKVPLPLLAPRNASAPPPAKLEGERRPVQGQQGNAPDKRPADADRPGTPPRPGEANRPEPQRPDQPGQANLPPVRDRSTNRPETPRTGDVQRTEPNRAEPSRPAAQSPEPPRPGQPDQAKLPPVRDRNEQRPESPRTGDAQRNEPNRAEPPRAAQPAQPPKAAAEPPRQTEAPRPPQAQPAPQQRPAETPKPPQVAKPAEAPKQPQAAPQAPHQATPPAPGPQRDRETRAAPPPQPQRQAPPPQQQTRAPAPQPPVQHAAPPQQAQAPRPAPQPQQQVQRPAPQPQQAQAPRPQQQQQQPQHNQQAQAPQNDKNDKNDKK
ncbi:DUF6600 domain-containing protein [Reyranella sp.]|uniref:DUF6600 domain-containing protein n=1 Tax=Reyranella sp. TaxID=1929291 RepID=UPI003D0BD04A